MDWVKIAIFLSFSFSYSLQLYVAYLLYDQGYDVWMGNARGNTYSRNHVKYNENQQQFWDFSFHELAVFDLPASIDYVLHETNHTSLHYIGHSQGTTSFFILGSERPEYMKKIFLMQALAPIVFFRHCKSPPVVFLGATELTGNVSYFTICIQFIILQVDLN